MNIPEDLQNFVSEFALPTGATIKKSRSSDYGLEGWIVQENLHNWVYSDGIIAYRPTYRALAAMNLSSEDDLHGQSDKVWKQYEDMTEKFTHMLLLPLQEAYELAKAQGLMNLRPPIGTKVKTHGGEKGVVTQDFAAQAQYSENIVRVKFEDGEEKPVYFSKLIYNL